MKIAVYEHVSGGGFAGQPIPAGVLAEGFAMLRSFVADLTNNGHEVTILLDSRLAKMHPPIDAFCILPISQPEDTERYLSGIAKINDATYIIAPEARGTLQSLVKTIEKTNALSLNCKSEAISKVANKASFYDYLQNNGFSTPETLIFDLSDPYQKIDQTLKAELSYPIVVKPADGTSCSGLSIVKEETQLQKAISKLKAESSSTFFVVQELIEGESCSVSVLATNKKSLAFSLNKQYVTLSGPDGMSSYNGGCVPFVHSRREELFILAQEVVQSVRGLQGYIGIDLILTDNEVFVVDVNPRLTTSYVGLREVCGFNIAEALIDAVLMGKLPRNVDSKGFACFSKEETTMDFQEATNQENVVSPPLNLNSNAKPYSLFLGKGKNEEEAWLHLQEARRSLKNNIR
jgi:predicted ATP-grasp superfamily ATP-dependent carboligase